MPSRVSHRLIAALLAPVLLLGAAACGEDDPDDPAGDGPDAVATTERALAAAVETHLGRPAHAAAPLFAGDGLPEGALGVELTVDRPVGDRTHVRVLVVPPEAATREVRQLRSCRGEPRTWTCEEDEAGDTSYVLLREAGAPEEDPGVIAAVGRRDDVWVVVTAYGPLVPYVDGEGEADDVEQSEELAELARALVTDAAVGLRTSAAYAEAGQEIDDDRWLDYYGQGNGAPEPEGYRPT